MICEHSPVSLAASWSAGSAAQENGDFSRWDESLEERLCETVRRLSEEWEARKHPIP
jgi:hypothetical protein